MCVLAGFVRAATPVTVTIDPKVTGPQISENFSGLSFETKLMLANENGQHYFRADNAASHRDVQTTGHPKPSHRRKYRRSRRPFRSREKPTSTASFNSRRAANVKVLYTLRLKDSPDPSGAAKIAKYIWSKYRDNVECFAIGNEPNMYITEPAEYCADEEVHRRD